MRWCTARLIIQLAVISHVSNNMSSAILRNFQAAKAAVNAERDCRAQGAATLKARFAAVMGASVVLACVAGSSAMAPAESIW